MLYIVCRYVTPQLTDHLSALEILQVIVKSYGQHTYLEEKMKFSKPQFYANLSLSSQVLCRKLYISVYLGEYLAKP